MEGTADFDLQGMFTNPDDPRYTRSYEVEERLFAVAFWKRRIFSATVDQFLAFMQYGYGAICMLPVLVDSTIVIDEVHSFDRSMLAALKQFLDEFEIPVLCMTATLNEDRRRELIDDAKLFQSDDRHAELEALASQPRYRTRVIDSDEAEHIVRAALSAGKRVLWVVNQVHRAQQLAMTLCNAQKLDRKETDLWVEDGIRLYCYHSRGGLAISLEGGLEEFPEFLRAAAHWASRAAIRSSKAAS